MQLLASANNIKPKQASPTTSAALLHRARLRKLKDEPGCVVANASAAGPKQAKERRNGEASRCAQPTAAIEKSQRLRPAAGGKLPAQAKVRGDGGAAGHEYPQTGIAAPIRAGLRRNAVRPRVPAS